MRNNSSCVFLYPRSLLTADKIDVFEAINLVVYAKLPLKSAGHGKELVAGFIQSDKAESAPWLLSQRLRDEFLDRYGKAIGALQYPVGPAQYESLFEMMAESGDEALPYFFHEHHLLVDRQRRAAMFLQYYSELAELTKQRVVTLQLTDSERAHMLVPNAWMTRDSLRTYLDHQGVLPWWQREMNLTSHARLERILMSDTVGAPAISQVQMYDVSQLPSYVFGELLLRRLRAARRFARGGDSKPAASGVVGPEGGSSSRDVSRAAPCANGRVEARLPQATEMQTGLDQAGASVGRGLAEAKPMAVGGLAIAQAPVETVQAAVQSVLPAGVSTDETMLTKRGVAELLNVSVNTVDNYRKRPGFPKETCYGNNVIRWDRGEIRRWMDQLKSK